MTHFSSHHCGAGLFQQGSVELMLRFPFRGFGVTVAGKSGTAETPSGNPNGWFIGFASFEQPSVAFAAVFEEFKESPGNFASQASGTAVRAVLAAKFGLP